MTTDRSLGVPVDAMTRLLAQNWWAIAFRGLFAIAFGLVALILPGLTMAALLVWFAVYMLVDGVLAIVAGLRAAQRHERWAMLALEGVADLVAAGIAVLWPLVTLLAVATLLGVWAIVSGALLFAAGLRLDLAHGRWLMALGGAVSIAWGVLLILRPLVGALALAWWLGAYALLFGAALLALGLHLRRRRPPPLWREAQPRGI